MNWLARIVFVRDGPDPLAVRIKRKALKGLSDDYEVLGWRKETVPPLPGQRGTAYTVRLEKQEGPLKRVRIVDRSLERVRIRQDRVRIKE